MDNLIVYSHPCFLKHDTGPGHPERRERLAVLLDLFKDPPFNRIPLLDAPEADMEWITRAHPENHVMALQEMIPDHGYAMVDSDTVMSPGTWDTALRAAGAVCRAVDDVLAGKTKAAFCAVRPPGHHAGPEKAEGFCFFNNVFIGALHALASGKLARAAILDFDLHHGNGTDELARRHANIFFASTHQWPLYPGTGVPEDDIPGRVINVPLSAGDGSQAFRAAWKDKIFPALELFKPEMIFISAGFDGHKDDPLGQLNLVEDDYVWFTEEAKKIAARHAGGRIVSVLEGGYNLDALKKSVAAHLTALADLTGARTAAPAASGDARRSTG